jgi:hypothetical protein
MSVRKRCDCPRCRGIRSADRRWGFDRAKVKNVRCLRCKRRIGRRSYLLDTSLARFGNMFFIHKACAVGEWAKNSMLRESAPRKDAEMTPTSKMAGIPHVAAPEKRPEKRRDALIHAQDARICPHGPCGKQFTPRRKDQVFCSASCRKAAWFAAHFQRIAP